MYIDKLIKRELLVLIVSVCSLIAVIIGISYALFFSIDQESENTISIGDLKVKFCSDSSCKSNYENFGQVIGTKTVDGVTSPEQIYPYNTVYDALETTPYIFNIKNTGSLDSYLKIQLKEDNDYLLPETYNELKNTAELYNEHLRVGINDCNNSIDRENVTIYKYGELTDGVIIDSKLLKSGEENTYCLWTWLDESTPNSIQNTYFVANLDFQVEYKPKK